MALVIHSDYVLVNKSSGQAGLENRAESETDTRGKKINRTDCMSGMTEKDTFEMYLLQLSLNDTLNCKPDHACPCSDLSVHLTSSVFLHLMGYAPVKPSSLYLSQVFVSLFITLLLPRMLLSLVMPRPGLTHHSGMNSDVMCSRKLSLSTGVNLQHPGYCSV